MRVRSTARKADAPARPLPPPPSPSLHVPSQTRAGQARPRPVPMSAPAPTRVAGRRSSCRPPCAPRPRLAPETATSTSLLGLSSRPIGDSDRSTVYMPNVPTCPRAWRLVSTSMWSTARQDPGACIVRSARLSHCPVRARARQARTRRIRMRKYNYYTTCTQVEKRTLLIEL